MSLEEGLCGFFWGPGARQVPVRLHFYGVEEGHTGRETATRPGTRAAVRTQGVPSDVHMVSWPQTTNAFCNHEYVPRCGQIMLTYILSLSHGLTKEEWPMSPAGAAARLLR